MVNNSVGQGNGGGIFLHWVELTLQREGTLELMQNNAAENGGGIYAEVSTINANFSLVSHGIKWTSIHFFENHAMNGGGLYLCNSQVYSFASSYHKSNFQSTIQFKDNTASFGGAIFLDENCDALASKIGQCFIQVNTISEHKHLLHYNANNSSDTQNKYTFNFSRNYAMVSGSSVFKEEFDYCMLGHQDILELTSLTEVSNIKISDIGSHSIQVCLCYRGQPNCNYNIGSIQVIGG